MIDRGDLFTSSSGGTFRLLGVETIRGKKVAHVFGMDDSKALPKQWDLNDITAGLKDGSYEKLSARRKSLSIRAKDDSAGGSKFLKQDKPSVVLLEWRWDLIKPLVNDPHIFIRKHRGQLVADRAREMDVAANTIMTCLRLYWRGGMTKDALLGNFASCGSFKAQGSKKQPTGPIPRGERYEKFQWASEAQKKKVLALALTRYKARKQNTQHAVYKAVLRKFFSVINAEKERVPFPLGQRPTRRQVMHLLFSAIELEDRLRREHGEDDYRNNIAPKVGSARDYADVIAQYYEIDSTIVDEWICAEDDRNTVIGKATLYLIIDVRSRVIAGFHLTLDPPSWTGAMEAMMSLVEDKRELCERWGFDYDPDDWVAHGYWPQFFRADRGPEMVGYDSDSVADGVETGVINLPARNAPMKSSVECSFKLVHVPIKEHSAAYTPPSEQRKRQTDDHKDQATHTLKEVGRTILSAVRLNNRRAHAGIELPAEDIYKGRQPIPNEIWKREQEERVGMLTRFEPDDLRFKLLPQDTFTVTPDGIRYKAPYEGLYWVPSNNQLNKWLLRAEDEGNYTVTATFHRNLVDCIYVHDPKDSSKWTTMHLAPHSRHHAGKSFAQVHHLKDAQWFSTQEGLEHNLILEMQEDEALIARTKSAGKATQKAIYEAAGQSRTKNAAVERTAEADRNRQKTKVLQSTAEESGFESPPRSIRSSGPVARPTSTAPKSAAPAKPQAPAPSASNQGLLALMNIRK